MLRSQSFSGNTGNVGYFIRGKSKVYELKDYIFTFMFTLILCDNKSGARLNVCVVADMSSGAFSKCEYIR